MRQSARACTAQLWRFEVSITEKEFVRAYRRSLMSAPIKDSKDLCEYYLYLAPGINSALCHNKISPSLEDEVFEALIKKAQISKKNVQIGNRNKYSRSREDMSAVVFKTPSIYCHLKRAEGRACCLLRHIRNSIAHGEVYVKVLKNKTSQICLLDYDTDGKPSAQIVLTRSILEKWKSYLISLNDNYIVQK